MNRSGASVGNRLLDSPALLVVGGRIDTLRKAKQLGVRVVSLQHKQQFFPAAAEVADALIVADFTDWEAIRPLVRAAHERYRFDRAISLTEIGLEPASRINELLGLGGTAPPATRLLMDKWAMRQRLASAGTGQPGGLVPVASELFSDAAGLSRFAERHGYPLVVKPTNATASLGAIRIDGPARIPDAVTRVAELRRGDHPYPELFPLHEFMVEEYVTGPEYSVETFSFQGRHVVIAVTEKLSMPNFVELGHALPAEIDPATEQTLVEATTGLLDLIGVVDGAGHTELKLSPAGPRVIESHNRIGGDRIVDLVEAAYGIDLELYTVAWPARLVDPWPERPRPRCAAATRFLTAEPGTVEGIKGVADVRSAPDVLDIEITVDCGAVVRPLHDNWARVGQVLTTGEDAAAAVRRCQQLAEAITIATT